MTAGEPVKRVPDAELDFDAGLVYRWKGNLYTGIGYDDSQESGLSEINYRYGLQDGPARDWYPSGKLKGESYFRENVLHGPCRTYAPDGSLTSDEGYEYGILVSRRKFDHDGVVEDSWVIDPADSSFARLEKFRREKGWPSPGN